MKGDRPRIGIIGAGKVGKALALGLEASGYAVSAVSSRSVKSAYKLADRLRSTIAFESPQGVANAADLIFITTPDTAITEVAAAITCRPGLMVCHVAAAMPIEVLGPLREQGAMVGIFHPLQAIGSLSEAQILPGVTFTVEAEEPLKTTLKEMASRLACRSVELSAADRVLYHASAVMASNYLVTLVDLAAGLWQGFETKERAIRALLPMVRGTLDNIEYLGIPDCLTGPIARGDTSTVRRHLEAMVEDAPQAVMIYRELGLETIPIAAAKGDIDADKTAELKELLEN